MATLGASSEGTECMVAEIVISVSGVYIATQAALMISIITIWRIVFSRTIGKLCGNYSARMQCGTPKKPAIVQRYEANPQSKWKLDSLRYFYRQNLALMKTLKSSSRSRRKHGLDERLDFLKNSLNSSKSEIVDYFRYIQQTEKFTQHSYKLTEELWKCITVTAITIYGCVVISQADYFFDTKLFYVAYPQKFTETMEMYYKIGLGYHGHRALWQVFDTKRKDFWAMSIHHWVTILLIVGSWHIGCMQVGCVVMFCHDNGDALLSLAKVCVYNKWKVASKVLLAVFVVAWIIFRIVLYSWKIIYSLLFEAVGRYDCHRAYPVFVAGLSILLLLHFYWLRMILAMAFKSLCGRSEVKDTRSGGEDNDRGDGNNSDDHKDDSKSD